VNSRLSVLFEMKILLTLLKLIHSVYEMVVIGFALGPENAAILGGAKF